MNASLTLNCSSKQKIVVLCFFLRSLNSMIVVSDANTSCNNSMIENFYLMIDPLWYVCLYGHLMSHNHMSVQFVYWDYFAPTQLTFYIAWYRYQPTWIIAIVKLNAHGMDFAPTDNSAGSVNALDWQVHYNLQHNIVTTNAIVISTWYDAFAMITGYSNAQNMKTNFLPLKLQRCNYDISFYFFEITVPIEYILLRPDCFDLQFLQSQYVS